MNRASELSKKIAEFRKQHITNHIDWENKILVLFHQLGDWATLKKIYELIENSFNLKSKHFEVKFGRPAYEHQVRSHISNLVQSGHLKWVDRGQYRITEKGLNRITRIRQAKTSPIG